MHWPNSPRASSPASAGSATARRRWGADRTPSVRLLERHHAKAYRARALALDGGRQSQTLYLSAPRRARCAFVTSARSARSPMPGFRSGPVGQAPLANLGCDRREQAMTTTSSGRGGLGHVSRCGRLTGNPGKRAGNGRSGLLRRHGRPRRSRRVSPVRAVARGCEKAAVRRAMTRRDCACPERKILQLAHGQRRYTSIGCRNPEGVNRSRRQCVRSFHGVVRGFIWRLRRRQ